MRLVSAFYPEYHPFYEFPFITSAVVSSNPDHLTEKDILLLWGGQDIHPSLYGKQASPQSQAYPLPTRRDNIEWAMIKRAKQLNIPIIGVCRGAQMLCAAAGGYLMQHVTGHAGWDHDMLTPEGETIRVNSLHHQMMVPGNTNHELLGFVNPAELRSKVYWDEEKTVDHHQEPEYIYFKDIRGFAMQWHPEMMPPDCRATKYIQETMEERLEIAGIL